MFVLSNTHATYRVVAILVAVATVLFSLGLHIQVDAANVTDFKDTLSDSAPSAASNHEIEFVSPTGIPAGQSIVVTFPTVPDAFDLEDITVSDIDLEEDGVDETLGAGVWTVSTTSTSITFLSGTGAIAADATTTIKIGTNADAGTNRIINPATSNVSYEITLQAGTADSGATRVAIVDTVEVTASVATDFVFTVTGLATSSAVNGTTTTGSTSPTLIGFGELTQWQPKTMAQRLNVRTNARNGFVVTVEQDQNLLSSTGADIDGYLNGGYTNTPGNWSQPGNTILLEDTYGHWGLTSTDDLNSSEFQGCVNAATEGCWVAASTTPRDIFEHNGPSDGTTDDVGSTTVGYQVEISPLQEAGDDYTTTLTYIATPTF